MEIIIILLLILANGFFAMSEIALVSSKKSRLEEFAKKGDKKASLVLKILENPEKFLSTVQVGVTLIGILAGAFGAVAIAEDIQPHIADIGFLKRYSYEIAFVLIVASITYLSIVIGELVPKTIAFNNPERISKLVAPFIYFISKISMPVVALLSFSTKIITKLLFIKPKMEAPVTEEELKLLLDQAKDHGIFEKKETEMIKSILRFGDRKAYSVMIPRQNIEWINLKDNQEHIRMIIPTIKYSIIPVCEESVDNVKGVIYKKDYYELKIKLPEENISSIIKQPLYIPENLPAIKVLEEFRSKRNYIAIVVNEYGSTEGLITLHDLIENIFGDLPEQFEKEEIHIHKREDGSLLIDGGTPIDELKEVINIDFSQDDYSTLGGYMMFKLNKIPVEGDHFIDGEYRFEVVDMDEKRVDKVLVQETVTNE